MRMHVKMLNYTCGSQVTTKSTTGTINLPVWFQRPTSLRHATTVILCPAFVDAPPIDQFTCKTLSCTSGFIIIAFMSIAFRKFHLAGKYRRVGSCDSLQNERQWNERLSLSEEQSLVISWYTIGFHISFQCRARLSRFRSHVLAASKVTGDVNCQIFYVTFI